MHQKSDPSTGTPSQTPARERLSFNDGWRFHGGDIPFPEIKGHGPTYESAKAGNAHGAAAPGYDDTDWRVVRLPHDWVVEGPFDPEANLSQGYRNRGAGWYRRTFSLPEADRGRHLEIQIDGAATHATVWLNGTVVHRNWCGYTSFLIDITPFARYGEDLNTLAIRVDAQPQEGWWYEGGGLYRHAWLTKRHAVHLVTDGVFAQPVRQADGRTWALPVEAELYHCGETGTTVGVVSVLLDPDGNTVATASATVVVEPLQTSLARLEMEVRNPRLWSVDEPVLYSVRTGVVIGGTPVDSTVTPLGFRTFRWDANEGFFLNDQPLKIQGTCNHQDHAGVGVAVPDSIWDFRVRRLKEMGSNAFRCAHNPPAKEFLEACDRLGMLVMDENRHFNCSPETMRQIEWLVRRDRNHPSVFLWSVFNEEPQQGTVFGYEMVRRMAAAVRKLDPTRPVTAAMNGGFLEPVNVSQAVDVVGFNYSTDVYDEFHARNPQMPCTSSEDTSAFMTRGEYETDPAKNRMGSYDDECAPWGHTHRDAWRKIAERPWLAGGFVWTGFDYRGEPSPWAWPSASSFFGCLDLCGFPKTAFYLHQAHWINNRPVLQIAPHWNWQGREGEKIQVMAISNAAQVELFLNGKSLGEKPVDPIDMASWQVCYEPGRIEAVARTDGREVARFAVETTGEPARIGLLPDRSEIAGDGRDAVAVGVTVLDADGRPVPTASNRIKFFVEGPGEIIGLGNGDPNCHEPEKGNERSLFHGLAQVILQSGTESGELTLRAESPGVASAECRIVVRNVPGIPSVPPVSPPLALDKWRQSPAFSDRPDPCQPIPDNDQNSWVPASTGFARPIRDGSWTICRCEFTPFASHRQKGGVIQFSGIAGTAEVWLNGTKIAEKPDPAPAAMNVPFPSSSLDLWSLNILIEAQGAEPVGLAGSVAVGAG